MAGNCQCEVVMLKAFSVNDWSKWLFSKPCFYSLYPFIRAFFSSCSFLLTYWHHCEAVLPELLNIAGNLCFFLELALRGIGETFSYLYGFICVCSHSCIYVGFCMRVCYMRRNVKTNASIFHLCVSNQFILTRIILRQKRIG